MRSEAIRRARIAPKTYLCAGCSEHMVHEKGEKRPFAVDHVETVTPTGEWNWADYIARLMCPPEGLQILCHPCHKAKTANERQARRIA